MSMGSDLWVFYGNPVDVFNQLFKEHKVTAVYTNHDYEPYALKRDESINNLAKNFNIGFHSFKDQVIFEKLEIVKADGKPYTIFTPYMRKWKEEFLKIRINSEIKVSYENLSKNESQTTLLAIEEFGFSKVNHQVEALEVNETIIKNYHKNRDNLALENVFLICR